MYTVTKMAPNKSTKGTLSQDAKDSIKESLVELKSGAGSFETMRITPSGVHTKTDYAIIVDVLRGGKPYIMEINCSRNTIYNVRKAITDPTADWNTNLKEGQKPITAVKFGEVQTLKLNADGTPAQENGKPVYLKTKNTALYLA